MLLLINSRPLGLNNLPWSLRPPIEAAMDRVEIRPLSNSSFSISTQVMSGSLDPHCEAPTEVITIG